MTNDYQPIACDLHSEFELLAMHGAWVELVLAGETGGRRVRVRDVVTRTGAEYLVTETEDGQRQEWRLDLVRQLRRVPPRAAP